MRGGDWRPVEIDKGNFFIWIIIVVENLLLRNPAYIPPMRAILRRCLIRLNDQNHRRVVLIAGSLNHRNQILQIRPTAAFALGLDLGDNQREIFLRLDFRVEVLLDPPGCLHLRDMDPGARRKIRDTSHVLINEDIEGPEDLASNLSSDLDFLFDLEALGRIGGPPVNRPADRPPRPRASPDLRKVGSAPPPWSRIHFPQDS